VGRTLRYVATDREERRALLWELAWYVGITWVLDRLGVWMPVAVLGGLVAMQVSYRATHRRALRWRWLWLQAYWRGALTAPVVRDEDGRVHVPVMLPGDTLAMLAKPDGTTVGVHVHSHTFWRRRCTTRATAHWDQ
jgi:hypothetical protein